MGKPKDKHGAIIKNHEMVGFDRDHLKTQKISKNAVNKNIKTCDKVIMKILEC